MMFAKGANLNNALTVNLGLKRIKVVIIWQVDANIDYVMFVVDSMGNIDVLEEWELNYYD